MPKNLAISFSFFDINSKQLYLVAISKILKLTQRMDFHYRRHQFLQSRLTVSLLRTQKSKNSKLSYILQIILHPLIPFLFQIIHRYHLFHFLFDPFEGTDLKPDLELNSTFVQT
ncbi:MAG: hypothetical protein ACI8YP_002735 [Algoriphagus sp.]|jgi:hypothetical protein